MVFTSWAFVKFFVVVLIGLWLMPTRRLRQLLILVASAFFYAYWKPSYLLILAVPSMIDYFCAIKIEESNSARNRKRWLVLSLVTNLGLLGYFKYTNFFIDNISILLNRSIPHLNIVLPIGISFFTFKTLSYTFDVYRREIRTCRSLWQYAMFVTYFPELIAGPIVRASVFLPQMGRSLRPSWPRAVIGLQVVLLGATKKLVIADRLSLFVDAIFAHPSVYSPLTVISAVIAYSLQIYCDFSGYSDMAIGVSKIIGFDLPENFNMPYLSTSVIEFWKRWHITLSNWLRDYVYFSIGGLRKNRWNKYRNLLITMFLGGLWHGASWTFVFWGLLHGVALVVNHWWEDRRRIKRQRARQDWWIKVLCWAATYLFICISWIFFRAQNFSTAIAALRKVTGIDQGGVVFFYTPFFLLIPLIVLGHLVGVLADHQSRAAGSPSRRIPAPAWARWIYSGSNSSFAVKPSRVAGIYFLLPLPGFVGAFILTVWLLFIYLFASLNTNPFIYFQF
jgi:alginate O-acetyltransferase complex protein AlgI